MNFSDLDLVFSRKNSESVKWNRYPDDVLPLWVADMDFPTSERIIQAMRDRLDHPFFGYGASPPEVFEYICAWVEKRHNWQIKPEHILLTSGVVTGINWTAQALLQPGESLIFQTPVYPPFFKVAGNAQVRGIEVPFVEGQNQYEIDFDLLERSIEVTSRLFILCNPHNPLGRVFTRQELEKLADICLCHDCWICSDEIHCDLVYSDQTHLPIAALSDELAQKTVTLMAPSKTFNIPGLHFSFAVVPNDELREKMSCSKRGLVGHPGLLAHEAARAAYQYGETWLEELLMYLEMNRDFAIKYLAACVPQIKVFQPQGTYLLWMDCSQLNLGAEPFDFFLREAKVGLNRGLDFGSSSGKFVRLNFACPREILAQTLERISYALVDKV